MLPNSFLTKRNRFRIQFRVYLCRGTSYNSFRASKCIIFLQNPFIGFQQANSKGMCCHSKGMHCNSMIFLYFDTFWGQKILTPPTKRLSISQKKNH